ncbi:MAG: GntR family transcriptional regulator, partial [Acidiferrobacteraceae bacterium]|nr:GntR family transcriptional regulator [Acidiferrobacteraceae bacterium]
MPDPQGRRITLDTLIELLISEPKLTEEFGVSQGTIRRALDDLVLQGSLVRHQGR